MSDCVAPSSGVLGCVRPKLDTLTALEQQSAQSLSINVRVLTISGHQKPLAFLGLRQRVVGFRHYLTSRRYCEVDTEVCWSVRWLAATPSDTDNSMRSSSSRKLSTALCIEAG